MVRIGMMCGVLRMVRIGFRWGFRGGSSVGVSGGRFSGRQGHQAVSYGGSLLVIGGFDGGLKNDVWRSLDGVTWYLVGVSGGHFSGRRDHQAVSYGGSLWVIGGV